MNTRGMIKWIVGTTLLAVCACTYYWGEHDRPDDLQAASRVELPGQPAVPPLLPHHYMAQVGLGEAAPDAMIEMGAPGTSRLCRIDSLTSMPPTGAGLASDEHGEPVLAIMSCFPLQFAHNPLLTPAASTVVSDVRL